MPDIAEHHHTPGNDVTGTDDYRLEVLIALPALTSLDGSPVPYEERKEAIAETQRRAEEAAAEAAAAAAAAAEAEEEEED